MKGDAWNLVFTGLSLTCVMATALFLMVSINPRDPVFGSMPLVYAGGSAAVAFCFNRAAARAARPTSKR